MLEGYNDVITVDDLCEILHIGRNKAYLMLQSNQIRNRKIGQRYIIPKISVENYLTGIADAQ